MEFDNIWSIINRLEMFLNSGEKSTKILQTFGENPAKDLTNSEEYNRTSKINSTAWRGHLGQNLNDTNVSESGVYISEHFSSFRPTQAEIFLGCFCTVSGDIRDYKHKKSCRNSHWFLYSL